MELSELMAQIRAIAAQYPAIAAALDKPKREKRPKRVPLLRPKPLAELFLYRPVTAPEPRLIGKVARAEHAEAYRARIDASAEREGMAMERLERRTSAGRELLTRAVEWKSADARRIVRRFVGNNRGDVLSTWHYLRALSRSLDNDIANGDKGASGKRGELSIILRRYDYRRAAARQQWDRICDYFRRRVNGEILPPLPNRLPGWARQTAENEETRARRKLQRGWRDIVRAVGAAKIAGIPGAADLYAEVSAMRL